jgi:hypothetical protein
MITDKILHKESSESTVAIELTTSRTCNRRLSSTLYTKICADEDKAKSAISVISVVTRTFYNTDLHKIAAFRAPPSMKVRRFGGDRTIRQCSARGQRP